MNNIIIELEKRIENLNEQLGSARNKAKESIDDIKDSHIGITKYSEEIMIILAKIDSYRDSLNIIRYFQKLEEKE